MSDNKTTPTMNYEDFVIEVSVEFVRNPAWRHGQTIFNTLSDVHPTLAEQIRATPNDPFYISDDDGVRLIEAYTYLKKHWDD